MAQGKKEIKKRWLGILLFVGLIAVLLVILRATWSLYRKDQIARDNLQSSVERLAKLKERELTLQDKIERLKTPRGIEEEIRNNYPMVKPGEKVINIVDEGQEPSTTATTTTKSWWQIF